MSDFDRAIQTVVRRCVRVREGEDVLVVADSATERIGRAMREEAQAAGADATLALVTPRATDGNEPPRAVAAALAACDVFLAPTSWSISHTVARKQATENGARGATLPTVTEDMLGRLMGVDFAAMAARSAAVARLLSGADDAHVTCPLGTDLRLALAGRQAIADDGDLSAPGAFGNLPCGEGFISPVGGDGVLHASSLASVGLAEPAAQLIVSGGSLAEARGPRGERLMATLRAAGQDGTNLAELGVGTNDRATLTGNILEDEKLLGTVHIAFGASAGIGGTVSVPVHLDVVVLDATLTIGDTPVIDAGRFLL